MEHYGDALDWLMIVMSMKKTPLVFISIISLLFFAACKPADKNPVAGTKVGSFLYDAKASLLEDTPEGKIVLDFYSDPACSGCVVANLVLEEEMNTILGDKAVIRYHAVSKLGGNDEQSHSRMASKILLSLADLYPDEVMNFKNRLNSYEVYELRDKLSEEAYRLLYIDTGGSDEHWKQIVGVLEDYEDDLDQVNQEFNKIEAESGLDKLYIPAFIINGEIIPLPDDVKELSPILQNAIETAYEGR